MITPPATIYVFDLDGVITDPENSQIDEQVVAAMYSLLGNGTYVAINTGRSYDWVEKNLIERLRSPGNSAIFKHFVVACEKGGELITWQNGKPSTQASEFALPKDAYDHTKVTFKQNQTRLPTMFWDTTKRTMATIEKLPAADFGEFQAEQVLLVSLLTATLAGYTARVVPTTIATDIELPTAGKYAGAQLIYHWAQSVMGHADSSFISIGDNVSDYETARCFAERGVASTFVYVGKPTDAIAPDPRVTFISTAATYAPGTLEFLNTSTAI